MPSWKKLGKLFDPREVTGIPWMHEFAQAPATLVFDSFVRIYFSCRPKPDANGQYVSRSGYVDVDRADLRKIQCVSPNPILDLGRRGTFDEFGTYPVSVIRTEQDLRVYYGGWTRCEAVPFNVAIGVASSLNDGETFSKLGDGPVLSYTPDEPFILSGPKIRRFCGSWQLYYIAGRRWITTGTARPEPVYRIRMATSDDGVNWTKAGRDLIPAKLDDDECQASPDVLFRNGRYHMFFCYRHGTGYKGPERGYRIGYATSEDCRMWERKDQHAGIDVSASGWDSEMVSYPHVFELDGKIWMLYLGNDFGRHGFGLAELDGEL